MDKMPEFSRIVQISELGSTPFELDISASSKECAALIERLAVDGLENLKAHVSLSLLENSDVDVSARFSACVTQPCAVTLTPVESKIKANFTITYSNDVEEEIEEEDETVEDYEPQADPPEPLIDEKIDVGAAVVEHLALEIDPFPRVKGAVFEGFVSGSKDVKAADFEKKNPFAVLSELKTKQENKKNKE